MLCRLLIISLQWCWACLSDPCNHADFALADHCNYANVVLAHHWHDAASDLTYHCIYAESVVADIRNYAEPVLAARCHYAECALADQYHVSEFVWANHCHYAWLAEPIIAMLLSLSEEILNIIMGFLIRSIQWYWDRLSISLSECTEFALSNHWNDA